ncbi:restriction endonuclease subunit S [Streptomyces sp. NBC_01481]|nr:restriction endonuclease subunit S [Streptomyces sp. NBC_01481]
MELPSGWAAAELGELLREPLRNGHSASRAKGCDGIRTLKLTAVTLDYFTEENTKVTSADPLRVKDLWLEPGDILVQRSNTPELIGTSALYNGPRNWAIYPDLLVRVRVNSCLTPNFAALMLRSRKVRDYLKANAKGLVGSMPKIDHSAIAGIRLPVPPKAEQHRIVAALEGHLSHLDMAALALESARLKVIAFRKSTLLSFVPERVPESWEMSTVGEAGTVELGRQRHPDRHHGTDMHPYLRVANVFEDRIDTSDVMEMDFSGIFERYRLQPGDVLLNEGQSPHLVGRPALYRGTPPNVAFTNSLLRFRSRPDVLPEWALIVFRHHLHARRFMREAHSSTSIAHLSAQRLRSVEFPIPPVEDQKRLIAAFRKLVRDADAMDRTLERTIAQAKRLRSLVLDQAFSAQLVPQDPAEEPASVLLDRIRAARESQGRSKARPIQRPRLQASAPPPLSAATSLPVNAVQLEFEL